MAESDEFFEFAASELAEFFGDSDSAKYFPSERDFTQGVGSINLLNAIIGKEIEEEYLTTDGVRRRYIRTVSVVTDSANSAYCGVSNPLENAVIGIGNDKYSVTSITRDTVGVTDLHLKRETKVEISRENARSPMGR